MGAFGRGLELPKFIEATDSGWFQVAWHVDYRTTAMTGCDRVVDTK